MRPAAIAKLLQSCLTLCDPIDSNPPGSPIPGILQSRTLEWVAISFSNVWKWKVKVKSLSHGHHHSDPMDCSLPGSSIHGIFQARDLNAQEILHKYEQLILSLSGFSSILNLCPFQFFSLISSLATSWRVCVCVFSSSPTSLLKECVGHSSCNKFKCCPFSLDQNYSLNLNSLALMECAHHDQVRLSVSSPLLKSCPYSITHSLGICFLRTWAGAHCVCCMDWPLLSHS